MIPLGGAGPIFITEGTHGPDVHLRPTAVEEDILAAPIALHRSAEPLDRVETIVAGLREEDRHALSPLFGDRVWGGPKLPPDARGVEIQERLVFPNRFRP